MKKIRLILIVYLLCDLSCGWSQKVMVLSRADRLLMLSGIIADSVQIDRGILTVAYRFTRLLPADSEELEGEILMQIGEHTIKQSDRCLCIDNLIYTQGTPNKTLSSVRKKYGVPSNLFAEMYCDRRSERLTVVCGDWFQPGAMIKYGQQLPDIEWKLCDGSEVVSGYTCRKATGTMGGRTWSVWYAPEIPLQFGPWKLHGLPGLILRAEDEGNFRFECRELLRSGTPLFETRFDQTKDLKTRENYLRYEKSCFEHPYQTFAAGENAMIATTGEDGRMVLLDDSWSIPYNPIERE